MAVYSTIKQKELIKFLSKYQIGSLKNFVGILEGIENTNYKIITTEKDYILTIFEKRVNTKELPFFINLKNHLINKNFLCPKPISNKIGNFIEKINNKHCVLVSFIEGEKTNNVLNEHCEQVGQMLASFHNYTLDFKDRRKNGMNYVQWEKLFLKCKNSKSSKFLEIINIIENELLYLKNNWPEELPKGIIHADVFQDNVFFKDNRFSGLIDFYFSCYDFLAYDIAITINAWCFDNKFNFDFKKFQSLIKGYEIKRKLLSKEIKFLNVLLRGASLRILLTRLHDDIFHLPNAFVEPKDPYEYVAILKYHQTNNLVKLI